jgi:hypothetical protein
MRKLLFPFFSLLLLVGCEKEQTTPVTSQTETELDARGRAGKIDVCHYSADDDTWKMINISLAAVEKHLAHGDVRLDDQDGDGYVPDNECGFTGTNGMGDCNDQNENIHPGAEEDCDDGIDNNCNGDVDENDSDCAVSDTDGDGIPDYLDNCPNKPNPDQADTYGSSAGDACEDTDNDGTPDAEETNFCVSIDGDLIISQGTSICMSTQSIGTEPNIAIAQGDQAQAYAGTNSVSDFKGSNIKVYAIGDYAYAVAGGYELWGYDGANLTVTANGPGTYATAIPSSNTTSTATSTDLYNRASSQANYCQNCTSTATGNGANTAAGNGTNNHASGTGDNSYAWARLGNNNTATADGAGASATAHWGSNNTATSTGVTTCAGGTGPSNTQDNETAINEDKCSN